MEKKSNKLQHNEQLRIENQIRRMKLELEQGSNFGFRSTDKQSMLPPHIEKVFLDNIERFEKAFKNAKPVKIYEFIGKPEIRKAHSLKDDEISHELERMRELFFQHSISFDAIYEVDERILYAFITDELLEHEIDNIRVPGVFVHFIYEEFHPNLQNVVEDRCVAFMEEYLSRETFPETDAEITMMENAKQLFDFRNSFSAFDINELLTESVSMNGNTAEAVFKIEFTAMIEGSSQVENFSGFTRFYLKDMNDSWIITKCLLPGMNIE